MTEFSYVGPQDREFLKPSPRAVVLAACLAFIISGAPPFLSFYLRPSTWVIWIIMTGTCLSFARSLPLGRLMRPALPYLAWLVFYLIWGLIVSPITDIAFALKVATTTSILALCGAILTTEPLSLRTLAGFMQLTPIINLILLLAVPHVAWLSQMMSAVTQRSDVYVLGSTRYGGLYGNANMLGYICLITTIFSILAPRWIAWAGRLSCLPLFYAAASRKSMILFVLIFILYLVIVQRRNLRFWLVAVAGTFALVLAMLLSAGLQAESRTVGENPNVVRLMDLQEKETAQRGGETRIDLLHHWTSLLGGEPWYGYGLQAMAGDMHDEKDPEKVILKGVFPMGTHNTYLGVWIDIGPIGFFAFILVMLHYARKALFTGGDPVTQWVMASLAACNLIFLLVSHNHLFCFEGKTAFTLFFLLPSSVGLRRLGRYLTETRFSTSL